MTTPDEIVTLLRTLGATVSKEDGQQLRVELSGKSYFVSVVPDRYYSNLSLSSERRARPTAEQLHKSADENIAAIANALSKAHIGPIAGTIDGELAFIEERFNDSEIRVLVNQARNEHACVKDLLIVQRFEDASFHKKRRDQFRRDLDLLCINRERGEGR